MTEQAGYVGGAPFSGREHLSLSMLEDRCPCGCPCFSCPGCGGIRCLHCDPLCDEPTCHDDPHEEPARD